MRLKLLWVFGFILAFAIPLAAHSRDLGQWQYASPDVAEYFSSLKWPDNPGISCCGEADAYWADKTEPGPSGSLIAIITDTREDGPLMRPHLDVGTRIVVPANKIRKHPIPNPTSHAILFVGAGGTVYCFESLPLG